MAGTTSQATQLVQHALKFATVLIQELTQAARAAEARDLIFQPPPPQARARLEPPGSSKKKTAAEKEAERKELGDTLEVGSGAKNCVDLVSRPGFVGMGRDKRTRQFFNIEGFYAADGVPKPRGGKVPTDLTKLGPDVACPCVWMSKAAGIEEVMCTSAGCPGHERGGIAARPTRCRTDGARICEPCSSLRPLPPASLGSRRHRRLQGRRHLPRGHQLSALLVARGRSVCAPLH